MADVWTLLQQRRLRAPGEPVVTALGADGSRVELSATTLENAAAKIANALPDAFDVDRGDRVALRLPVHWQRSAWLAGAWTAGCVVDPDGSATDRDPALVVTTVADAATVGAAGVVAVVSLHPFGLPVSDALPPGVVDATIAVRSQPDAYLGVPAGATDAAVAGPVLGGLSQQEVLDLGRTSATAWGLAPGGRLLVPPEVTSADAWLAALAVPLATTASVVLVAGEHDLERVAAQERTTAVVT